MSNQCLQQGTSEALAIQGGQDPVLSALRGFDLSKTVVIFDEAHKLSNPSTDASITAKYVAFRAKYIFCMTATPMKNGPHEASVHFNLFNILFPTVVSSTVPPNPSSQRYD